MTNYTLSFVQQDGVAPPSMVSKLVKTLQERYGHSNEYIERENSLKDAAGTAYGGEFNRLFTLYNLTQGFSRC